MASPRDGRDGACQRHRPTAAILERERRETTLEATCGRGSPDCRKASSVAGFQARPGIGASLALDFGEEASAS
jgi:hypothetical protein